MNTMQPSTTIGIVFVALIFLGLAGSALSDAARDCVERINHRSEVVASQLYGN
jgi:hypothetical protein